MASTQLVSNSQSERKVVRCVRCRIVQFRTLNGLCRRCRKPVDKEPEASEKISQSTTAERKAETNFSGNLAWNLAEVLCRLRTRAGLSQKKVADMMHVSLSRIKKIECRVYEPRFHTLEKFASIFRVNVSIMVAMAENPDAELSSTFRVIKSFEENMARTMKDVRIKSGLKIREIEDRTGWVACRIYSIGTTRGIPLPSSLKVFANAFGLTTSEIVGRAEDREQYPESSPTVQ